MKKLLIDGTYDFLLAGNVKFFKASTDFFLVSLTITKDHVSRKVMQLDSVTCISNNEYIPGPRSVYPILKKYRPDTLIIFENDPLKEEKLNYCKAYHIKVIEVPESCVHGKKVMTTFCIMSKINLGAITV